MSITADQVALMMVLLKVARTKTGGLNIDDYVDMAGYAGVAGEIIGTFNGLVPKKQEGVCHTEIVMVT